MGQEGNFKTAKFGGFDRKSVLDYIDSLTEKFHMVEQEYQTRIEEFSKAQDSQVAYIKRMESQCAEAQEKLELLAGELESRREADEGIGDRVSGLEAELAETKKKLADAERESQVQTERARQLQFKVESLSYKSRKYDEISNQVGDAMIEARRAAEQSVSEARAQAERMREETKTQSERLLEEASAQSERLVREAEEKAQALLSQAGEKAARLEEEARQQAEETMARTRSRMKTYQSELDCFQGDTTRLRKSIEEILFVLNDRVDVMQEIVRKMRETVQVEKAAEQEDPALFTQTEDEAGLFGTVAASPAL